LASNYQACKGDSAGIILDWAHKQTDFSSSDIIVSRNTITNCRYEYGGGGIILWKAGNSSVFSNMLVDNKNGIILRNEETRNNLIYNNDIERSNFGISVKLKASKNVIYNNKIINNHIELLVQNIGEVNFYTRNYYEKCKGCPPKKYNK
jgi:parallel beta-helix repeat protein